MAGSGRFEEILGASRAALLAAAAPTASFCGEPGLEPVVMCLAAAALIQGFENIGTVERS
jgi:hypothetical protein